MQFYTLTNEIDKRSYPAIEVFFLNRKERELITHDLFVLCVWFIIGVCF